MTLTENDDVAKVALITGAARRVGAEIVRQLHARGLNIVLHYRKSAKDAESLATELNALRPKSVKLVSGDLADTAILPEMMAQAIASWGRLDVLVNNASSFYPTELGSITETQWDDLFASNLKGPLFLAQAAADALRQTGGTIVNIVDIHADRPLKGYTVYCCAKAGLVMLTKSLARELGPDVRCNGIAPGAILWPEHPAEDAAQEQILARTALKRAGSPQDIASAVTYLACDAPYVTGQILAVDGGRTLSN